MALLADGRTGSFALKRPGKEVFPSRVVTVAHEASYDLPQGEQSVYGDLLEWAASYYRIDGGVKTRAESTRAITKEAWWTWLYRKANGAGLTWVVGWRMYPFLCLVDLFGQIDDGELILASREKVNSASSAAKYKRKLTGLIVAEDPPTIIILRRRSGGTIKFLDLANYGMHDETKDFGLLSNKLEATERGWNNYVEMVKELGLGTIQNTAASQSYYGYRRGHMLWPIVVHPIAEPLKLERASYYGGRCEVAVIGKIDGAVWHLDVNSQYTAIARGAYFPASLLGYNVGISQDELALLSSTALPIAEVTITTGKPDFPLRDDGRVIYPVGTFRTVLAGPELELACRTAIINTVHRVAMYSGAPIFSTWASLMIAKRVELLSQGRESMLPCLKRLDRSLYGKFGQLSYRWVNLPERSNEKRWQQWWEPHPLTGMPVPFRCQDGVVQYQDKSAEGKLSCPAISSYMSSYARVSLVCLMEIAGRGNTYYWDTDSLMVNDVGYINLVDAGFIDGGEPGKLKIIGHASNAEIFGVKHYRLGDRFVCAGSKIKEPLAALTDKWNLEHVGYSNGLWHSRAGEPKVIARRSVRTQAYKQGRVMDDGKVVPFRITEPILEGIDNGKAALGNKDSS